MKRLIVTLTVVVSIFCALHLMENEKCYAQSPIMWQENGIPIRQGSNVDWNNTTVQMGEDKVLAVWTDTRTGFKAVIATLYDKNGKAWEEDLFVGEQVYWEEENNDSRGSHASRGIHFDPSSGGPVVVKSSDGCVIVAWIKTKGLFDEDEYPIAINKISEDGELLWGDGFVIPNANAALFDITPDNEGGVYIVWLDNMPQHIYGLHLNASGELYSEEWNSETGLQLFGNSCCHFSLSPDGENGFVMTVAAILGSMRESLIIKRISPNGETLWNREIKENHGTFRRAIVVKANEDCFGVYYAGGGAAGSLLLIDINGELVWQDTLYLSKKNELRAMDLQYTIEPEPCFIATWLESDNQDSIYSQKIDLSGNKLWGENGVEVAKITNETFYFDCHLDNRKDNVGMVVSWLDGDRDNRNIFIQQIDTDGNLLLGKEGIQITDIKGYSQDCSLNIVNNDLYATWSDNRNESYDIYYQVYDEEMQPLFADNGKVLYQGLPNYTWLHSVIRNEDYTYIVWFDDRMGDGNSQLMVQKIDNDGNAQFEENGIVIVTFNSYHSETSVSIVEHHSGGIAFTWVERKDGIKRVFAQAIGPNGETLWNKDGNGKGIEVDAKDCPYQNNPVITRKDEAYYFTWNRQTHSVRAQKIIDGQKMWGDGGVAIDIGDDYLITKHFLNGEYVLWTRRNKQENNEQLRLVRLNDDGSIAEGWDKDGIKVWSRDFEITGLRSVADEAFLTENGIVVIWDVWKRNDDTSYDINIYGQLVSPEGNFKWDKNGLPIVTYSDIMRLSHTDAFFDGEDVFLAWGYVRDDYKDFSVVIQKLDLDGNLLWGNQGSFLTQGDSKESYPSIVKSGNSVLVTWMRLCDDRIWSEVRTQLVSAKTGQPLWEEDGFIVSPFGYRDHLVATLDNNEAIIVWEDKRSSYRKFDKFYTTSNIYAQKVDIYSELSVDEDVAAPQEAMSLYANYPNPFNPETKISFNLSQNENVSLKVFNVKGQLVKTLLDEEYLENGKHIIVWDGRDEGSKAASSGIYFYRLEGEKESHTKKMALIK